uniref:HDC16478 n=1 Tax=Drosophila melanogaster TaxID=7227 RepID=Q6IIZ2_DROME|nr:TPA_inf: HDC16478 [Drosophila melanogaster]
MARRRWQEQRIQAAIPSPGAWVRAADQETRNYHPNKAKTSRPIYVQTIAIICNSRCSRAFSEIERVNSARKVNKNLMLNAYRFHHHHLHLHLHFHQKSKPNSPNSSGNSIHLFLVEKRASKEKARSLRWGDGDLIADSRMTLHTRQKLPHFGGLITGFGCLRSVRICKSNKE